MHNFETYLQADANVHKMSLAYFTQPFTLSPPLSKTPLQSKEKSCDEAYSQAINCISLIEDPLWKKVCIEFIDMMGSTSVLKIWKCNLGSLSPKNKTINLFCQTAEAMELLQQYDFVILGTLRRYFPELQELCLTGTPNN